MPRTPIAASTTANADYFGAGYLALYRDHLIPPEQTAAECDFLLRELAPRAGDRWLDIPCGYGRHTIELRRRAPWLRLVGGDLNHTYLREALSGGPPALARCDMRHLPFATDSFDVVLNLLNSFGYAETPAGDRTALAEWRRVLKPGGTLVLDLPNREALLHAVRLHPGMRYIAGDYEVEESFVWDAASACLINRTRWRWPGGTEQRGYRPRLYTPAQIDAMLEAQALDVYARYGDFSGGPFDRRNSDRLLLFATAGSRHA